MPPRHPRYQYSPHNRPEQPSSHTYTHGPPQDRSRSHTHRPYQAPSAVPTDPTAVHTPASHGDHGRGQPAVGGANPPRAQHSAAAPPPSRSNNNNYRNDSQNPCRKRGRSPEQTATSNSETSTPKPPDAPGAASFNMGDLCSGLLRALRGHPKQNASAHELDATFRKAREAVGHWFARQEAAHKRLQQGVLDAYVRLALQNQLICPNAEARVYWCGKPFCPSWFRTAADRRQHTEEFHQQWVDRAAGTMTEGDPRVLAALAQLKAVRAEVTQACRQTLLEGACPENEFHWIGAPPAYDPPFPNRELGESPQPGTTTTAVEALQRALHELSARVAALTAAAQEAPQTTATAGAGDGGAAPSAVDTAAAPALTAPETATAAQIATLRTELAGLAAVVAAVPQATARESAEVHAAPPPPTPTDTTDIV